MSNKKAPPRRNTDVIRCENCGEEYSTTYKRCPFCDERPGGRGAPAVGGRRMSGGRGARGRANPLQAVGLIVSLVLIAAAVIIVITSLAPMVLGRGGQTQGSSQGGQSTADGSGSQAASVTLQGLSLNRTEVSLQAGETYQLITTTDPADAQVTTLWSSGDDAIATVDEFGNIVNVYQGSDTVQVTITASAGGQTAQCVVQCTGDGTGANVSPSGGQTTTPSAGTLSPNTEAVITGASGGLNIRSGPGTTYTVQASTANGATVTVLEASTDGWYKIRYSTGGGNYEEGYVLGTYLAAK